MPPQPGLFGPLDKKDALSPVETVPAAGARLVRVAFESGADRLFDYALPAAFTGPLAPGQRVRVPFGKASRLQIAFCAEFPETTTLEQVKVVSEIVDPIPLLDPEMMELAHWIARYYCCPLGLALSAMVPAAVKHQVGMKTRKYLRLTPKALIPDPDGLTLPRSKPARAILYYLRQHSSPQNTDHHPPCHSELKKPLALSAAEDKESQLIPNQGGAAKRSLGVDDDGWQPKAQPGDGSPPSCRSCKSQNPDLQNLNELPLDQVARHVNCGPGPFGTLARAGLIEIITRRELTQPDLTPGVEAQPIPAFNLNQDQQKVLETTCKLIAQNAFLTILLHGVTGSGKTEIYMCCIEKIVQNGRQALVLVPEIALTPQTLSRFLGRFSRVAVLHSALASRRRHQQWRYIADGRAQVVIGPRSAIFAPLPDLGIIIVDEEHESSYKQDTAPRYHARDVAIKLAQIKSIPVILGSATPSLETLHNCKSKTHYHLLSLPQRVKNLPLPKVHLVDMRIETVERKGRHLLSRILEHELHRCLEAGKQAILLLNRRGHSSYIFCPSCGFTLTCPNCDVSLTCHKTQRDFDSSPRRWVMCHYCSHSTKVPSLCAVCGKKLLLIGPGTQQAQEELTGKFPQARLRRVDSDSMTRDAYTEVMTDFGSGKIDILLGTQMIGKGLDFPGVMLVGVLNADTALSLPDFRSSERTFQLITQVAGRCGRASPGSRVIVQSYVPQDTAVARACEHDYKHFSEQELRHRQRCGAPPYQRWARIILRDKKLQKVEESAGRLREEIDKLRQDKGLLLRVRGPLPAALARLEGYHRWQILLQAERAEQIQQMLAELRLTVLPGVGVQTAVDVDPINLL